MPAVLTENLFMDNIEDCKTLLSDEGKKKCRDIHVKGIKKYMEHLGVTFQNELIAENNVVVKCNLK